MEFQNNRPIYLQLYELIILDIIKGKLKPGDKILSIRDMASKYNLNPNTVINTLKELETNNIIISKRGLGSFIIEDELLIKNLSKEYLDKLIKEFLEKMYTIGYNKEEIIEEIRRGE